MKRFFIVLIAFVWGGTVHAFDVEDWFERCVANMDAMGTDSVVSAFEDQCALAPMEICLHVEEPNACFKTHAQNLEQRVGILFAILPEEIEGEGFSPRIYNRAIERLRSDDSTKFCDEDLKEDVRFRQRFLPQTLPFEETCNFVKSMADWIQLRELNRMLEKHEAKK